MDSDGSLSREIKAHNTAERQSAQPPQQQQQQQHHAMDTVSGTPEYHSSSKRPLRETVVAAVSFLFVFTSFQALQNLQSSLHQQQGLGVASLAALYASFFLVSFVTPAIVYNLGVKATILLAWVAHCVYVACNLYPTWWTLIPGSVLLELITCPLWTSMNTYLSALARVYVEQGLVRTPKRLLTVHAAFSKLDGLFQCIFNASQLSGNLISSLVLFQSSYDLPVMTSYPTTSHCGAGYCPLAGEGHRLPRPQTDIVYILLAVFLLFDLLGLGISWRFLPNLDQPRYTGREVLRKLRSYWTAFSQPKLFMLVPLFLSRGMNFSLHVGLFTEAYVSCALGIRMVGYVMAVWGVSTMLSAGLLGYAARFTGRRFLFGVGFGVDAAVFFVYLWWRPHSGSMAVFFCLAAVMGLVDGIMSVQCEALVAVLFPATVDSAFSVSGTWHALAMASSFLLARFLCPANRIYVALGIMGMALLGYVIVEVAHWRSLRSFDRDEHMYTLVHNAEPMDEREGDVEETVFSREVRAARSADGEAVVINTDRSGGGDFTVANVESGSGVTLAANADASRGVTAANGDVTSDVAKIVDNDANFDTAEEEEEEEEEEESILIR